jgi:hypothetical protein
MTTTRRNLLTTALATAVVPTLAFAAVASTAPHPIFAAMEAHRAAWHRVDDACTKVSALESSPETATVAAFRAAQAERAAIVDNEESPAYEALVAIAIAGVPHDAVMPLLRHMSKFDLSERLSDDELRQFVYSVENAAAKA